jgi:ATP synthase I chain
VKELDYGRIVGRIVRLMAVLAVAGTAAFALVDGAGGALSFLGGAAISGLSFWLLHRLVCDVTAAVEGRPVRTFSVLLHAFRLMILGGAAYAIVVTYGSSRRALAGGLILAVTAATLEVLLELSHARD